jgi:hypothetical protein
MLWFMIFLIGAICAVICVCAGVFVLTTASVQALLTCVERSLANLGNGHLITGALYLIPAWFFVCALAQFVALAWSFWQTVVVR